MRNKRQDLKIQRMSPRNSIVDKNKFQEKKKNTDMKARGILKETVE